MSVRAVSGAILVLSALAVPFRGDAQTSTGSVTGAVRDSLGAGLSMAEVAIAGSRQSAMTDAEGRFRIARVRAGEHALRIRRLGYHPETTTVTVTGGAEASVDIVLTPAPSQLMPVRISGRAAVYDARLAGFNSRRERGVGYFITRERLDAVHSFRFVDIMREVPGVRVGLLRGGSTVRMRGASCDPLVFIDGFPAAAGTVDLDIMDLNSVEGIEVYSGLASIPAEFVSVRGQERCGVIAIWSRPHRGRPTRGGRGTPTDLERLVAERRVFTAEDVDVPVRLEEGTAVPVYPDSLWRARVPGRVVVELVVEPDGQFEPATLRVVSATHPGFASAVRTALNDARFRAGMHDGRPIRQLVLLPFVFSPDSADSAASLPPPLD